MSRLLAAGAALAALVTLNALQGTPVSAQGSDPKRFGAIYVQCPGDSDGDAVPDAAGIATDPRWNSHVRCMHLAAGDGMVTMADGKQLYVFGFSDVTGKLPSEVMQTGAVAANFPAPTITLKEGDEFYLSLTNVGMVLRPDLFDAHSVHFHGFPQAASVFDGVPEASITIHMGSTIL